MNPIFTRRSIRKYEKTPVPKEIIKTLLKAGMNAPSAGNEQPWHFIVIQEREILDAIPAIHPYGQMLKDAPAAIVICGDVAEERFKGFWVQDCSAASQNILLEAVNQGLGAVWVGIYPIQERINAFQELLHIPAEIIPLNIIPIGYPAEQKLPAERYESARIHYGKW